MRSLLSKALLSVALVAALNPPAPAEGQVAKPNVLLIVADDLSFGDLGTSGAITRTPNIDRLAEQGLMFTRFHASPVCSVMRAMLLTGNYPVEVGLGAFDYALYPPADGKPGYESYLTRTTATIAELLHDAGYKHLHGGKMAPGRHRPWWRRPGTMGF
jgi:arylsulfatase